MSTAVMQETSFCQRSVLPAEMSPLDHQTLIAAGVKFGKIVTDDARLVHVELPQGWIVRPFSTVHDGGYCLDDELGRTRATMIYLPYLEQTSFTVARRFVITRDFGEFPEGKIVMRVLDHDGSELFRSMSYAFTLAGSNDKSYPRSLYLASTEAKVWLNRYYPGWEHPAKYWN